MKRTYKYLMLWTFSSLCYGQDPDALRNWFNDPFFQISSDVSNCPLPAGPFIDERAKRNQAHHRAEKGTTCWLAGDCDRPNSYKYDPDIADEFQTAVRNRGPFPDTTLWVTVQGRVVYVQGCGSDKSQIKDIEDFAKSVRYVQQVFVDIRVDPSARPPYRVREGK
jgi:hypothetical protein